MGLFKDDTMFGLYKEKCLYLRKSDQYLQEIKDTIPIHFLSDHKISRQSKIFYLVPQHIIENISSYSHWITSSISEYQRLRSKIRTENQTKIRILLNMNINIERLLARVNINTVDEFKQVGETKAFVRLIQQGFEVNQLLLFKLYGALQHKYIYMLSLEEKKRLLEQADSALYDAGLRKRFTV